MGGRLEALSVLYVYHGVFLQSQVLPRQATRELPL